MATFSDDYNFLDRDELWFNISNNIKKYRILANMTQEQLAANIGKSYDFTRRLEFKKGEVRCSLETLYRISVVLKTPIDNFFK